jgi:hypothetical protein
MRLASVVLGVVFLLSRGSADADCIDYEDYLHWTSSVDTPGYAHGAAVSRGYAYVADYGG